MRLMVWLAADAGYRGGLPRWDQWLPSVRDYTPLYVMLAALVTGLIVHYVRKKLAENEKLVLTREQVQERAQRAGLTHAEATALMAALKSSGVASPETAVRSEVYYNEFVGPLLRQRHGAAMRESIRSKLFSTRPEAAVDAAPRSVTDAATADLATGTQMRITFEQVGEPITAVVVGVEAGDFVVAFPSREESRLPLAKLDRVEGTYTVGQAMYAFTSEVKEVVHGAMVACRLAHSPTVELLHERKAPRVSAGRKVTFHHLSAHAVDGAKRLDISIVGSRFSDMHEGVLGDVSLGGCQLVTPNTEAFAERDLVEFTVPVREGVPPLEFFGTVVHVSEQGGGDCALHVSFLGLDDRSQHAIGTLVARSHGESASPATDAN